MNNLYTKKGDEGETDLADGQRVSKNHPRVACLGDLDELNAALGLLHALLQRDAMTDTEADRALLTTVQRALFCVGAWVAGSPTATPQPSLLELTYRLEQAIDGMPAGRFSGFVLPGGHPTAAQAHVVRAVCRRAERSLLLTDLPRPVLAAAMPLINRLSDYLFALAQKINTLHGAEEIKL